MCKLQAARKYLSARGLLGIVYDKFKKIKPPRILSKRLNPITLTDCLMSGLAIFGLKFPSLLKFDESKEEKEIKHNLRTLYHVEQAPSDTYMRERCDEIDPQEVRKVFKTVFSYVQRGKGLESFKYLDNHYLLAGDGTGFFSSHTVHCKNCCVKHYNKCHMKIQGYEPDPSILKYKKNTYVLVKNSKQPWELHFIDHERNVTKLTLNEVADLTELIFNKNRSSLSKQEKQQRLELLTTHYNKAHPAEEVLYHHNMYCAAIVHPDHKIALPLAPEPIAKTDGTTKNDSEQTASKRLYADARREHPHLKFIVVEDCLDLRSLI